MSFVTSKIDIDAARQSYAQNGFVQIPEIFATQDAQTVLETLESKIDWKLVFADPEQGVAQLTRADIDGLDNATSLALMQGVQQRASRNIGFLYKREGLCAPNTPLTAGHPLAGVVESLESSAFLKMGEAIIGETGLTHIEAQATLFEAGHFLTRHIDEGTHDARRVAFTLGFSKAWQTDWGGQLQLIDKTTTDVTSAWIPRFNTLTLFDGRIVHNVSQVASFAGAGRYSIVGWLRRDA